MREIPDIRAWLKSRGRLDEFDRWQSQAEGAGYSMAFDDLTDEERAFKRRILAKAEAKTRGFVLEYRRAFPEAFQ